MGLQRVGHDSAHIFKCHVFGRHMSLHLLSHITVVTLDKFPSFGFLLHNYDLFPSVLNDSMQNVGTGTSYFIIQTEVVFLRAYFLAFALPLLLPYI